MINAGHAPRQDKSRAAAVPTVANIPVPIIVPIPGIITSNAPNARLSLFLESRSLARIESSLLTLNMLFNKEHSLQL